MSFDGSTRNVVVTETVSETVDEANNLSFNFSQQTDINMFQPFKGSYQYCWR